MNIYIYTMSRGRRGRDRMEVELPMLSVPTATDVVSWISIRTRCTTLCDKSLSLICDMSMVFSTNKTDHHDITEILLKVALSTIKQSIYHEHLYLYHEHCRNIAHRTLEQHTTNQLWIKNMFLQNECMTISWKY